MAGFLDDYGAGDERRARIVKITVLSVLAVAVVTGLAYYFFHNFSQEQQVKRFFNLLEAHNYEAAYHLWAPTEDAQNQYPMKSFLQDWGPPLNVKGFTILDGESCDKSVIVDVDTGPAGDKKIWVDRSTLAMSFPPSEAGCVQVMVDGAGNLSYRDKHNQIYEWFRHMKYRLHGRKYQR
jgi:hypothetical protein